MHRLIRGSAGTALALCLVSAQAAPGLTRANFVDMGDSVSAVIDTSGLAFSVMMMGASALLPSARYASFGPPGAPTGGAHPERFTRSCPGGGEVAIDVLDANADGELSVGDRFTIDFRDCGAAGEAVSGRSAFTVAAHRFEGTSEITELDFRFDGLGSAVMRWTGAARAALRSDLRRGTESCVITYDDLAVTRGPHAMRWNFSLDMVRPPIGDQLARIRGAISVDALRLQLRQDEPFVIARDGRPGAGQLTATDRRGARLQLEAGQRRFAYRLFRAGNHGDTADARSESRPYGTR